MSALAPGVCISAFPDAAGIVGARPAVRRTPLRRGRPPLARRQMPDGGRPFFDRPLRSASGDGYTDAVAWQVGTMQPIEDDEVPTREEPLGRGEPIGSREASAHRTGAGQTRPDAKPRFRLERPQRSSAFLVRQLARRRLSRDTEDHPLVPFREDGMVIVRRYAIGIGAGVLGGAALGWALGNSGVGLAIGIAAGLVIPVLREPRPPRGGV